MRRKCFFMITVVIVVLFHLFFPNLSFATEQAILGDTFFISGTVIDYHNEPVKGAKVKILVNGQPQKLWQSIRKRGD